MVDFMQLQEADEESTTEFKQTDPLAQHNLLILSAAALKPGVVSPRTMQLQVQIQGHSLLLVDSGSSSCFLDAQRAHQLTGSEPLASPVSVQVAGGVILRSVACFPALN